jgi:hypothetical protein
VQLDWEGLQGLILMQLSVRQLRYDVGLVCFWFTRCPVSNHGTFFMSAYEIVPVFDDMKQIASWYSNLV